MPKLLTKQDLLIYILVAVVTGFGATLFGLTNKDLLAFEFGYGMFVLDVLLIGYIAQLVVYGAVVNQTEAPAPRKTGLIAFLALMKFAGVALILYYAIAVLGLSGLIVAAGSFMALVIVGQRFAIKFLVRQSSKA